MQWHKNGLQLKAATRGMMWDVMRGEDISAKEPGQNHFWSVRGSSGTVERKGYLSF